MNKKYSFSTRLTLLGVCGLLLALLSFVVLGQETFIQLAFTFLLVLLPASLLFCLYLMGWFKWLQFTPACVEADSTTQQQAELEPFHFEARTSDNETLSQVQ